MTVIKCMLVFLADCVTHQHTFFFFSTITLLLNMEFAILIWARSIFISSINCWTSFLFFSLMLLMRFKCYFKCTPDTPKFKQTLNESQYNLNSNNAFIQSVSQCVYVHSFFPFFFALKRPFKQKSSRTLKWVWKKHKHF